MQTYRVGGAVRDALLGLPVHDRDWVVVGATPEAMIAAGYLPVGKDFPVFLHPQTREEYALARTERKTGRGYHGFAFHAAPEVTLEQDLARRDLTINAIAQDDAGRLIDPFDGQADLRARVLRHVTEAFREDPVRILRVARFAARFTTFSVAPQTLALMREMTAAGEVDALVPERVWQELARGLMEPRPSRMFEVLRGCGALARLLPEIDALWSLPRPAGEAATTQGAVSGEAGAHRMRVVDTCAGRAAPLAVRFAALVQDVDDNAAHSPVPPGAPSRLQALCERLRVPNDCRELAEVLAREHRAIQASGTADAAALVRLLERCDAFRKPQRFAELLLACACDAQASEDAAAPPWPQATRLQAALRAAQAVATGPVAAAARADGLAGPAIGERIQQARTEAVARALEG